ncbi:MAG: hypothetical protein JNM56_31845 [Planctomycetia bacterium]|nr:hypothetical protein [Planctomycetia bacterium]
MRARVADAVLSNCLRFRPHLEQLTDRVVPAALVDFAGPLAVFDPAEADVMVVADEGQAAEEAAHDEAIQGEARPELDTEIDLTGDDSLVYLTCLPFDGEYVGNEDELLYFTCGFAEEGLPVEDSTKAVELTFATGEIVDDGVGEETGEEGEVFPGDGEWVRRDVEILEFEAPVDEPLPVDGIENPEIYYMMGGPVMAPTSDAEAAPAEAAAPATAPLANLVSALMQTSSTPVQSPLTVQAAPHGNDFAATPVAAATSLAQSSYSFTGASGGSDSEQDSGSTLHAVGGTQVVLPESAAGAEEVRATSQSDMETGLAEEAGLPIAQDNAATVIESGLTALQSEPVVTEQLEAALSLDEIAEPAAPSAGMVWGLSAAAALPLVKRRQKQVQ